MPTQGWRLQGKRAVFDLPVAAGSLHVDAPHAGVLVQRVDSSRLDGVSLLGPLLPEPAQAGAIRCGLRASEPFVNCPETPGRPVTIDARWSVTSGDGSGALVAIDLRLQAITSRLSADPRLPIESSMRASEVFFRGDGRPDIWTPAAGEPNPDADAVLLRLAGTELSYLEMPHPEAKTEMRVALAAEDAATRVRHLLFPEALEKGVLVQAFTRGAFLPRPGDLALAESIYASFVALTPPLAG